MALRDFIDQIVQNSGQLPHDRAITDAARGVSIIGRNNASPLNTDNHGYTFFTRPCLNLSYDNCMVDRRLSGVLAESPDSIQRMVRSYLDPWAQWDGLSCTSVDPLSPFINLLANNLISLNGWEDFTLNMSTSAPGVYRDAMALPDDVPYQYNTYTLNATVRNIQGDPISYMFYIWLVYMGLNKEGRTLPYPDLLWRNEFDGNTRIYRLIMDQSRTYVTRMFACGAAIPQNTPDGQIANFSGDGSESPFQVVNEQLNFSFICMGKTTYDYILVYEFNTLGEIFNPMMKEENRESVMVKLMQHEKQYFNTKAYPRINPASMELEWWVPNTVYNHYKSGNFTPAPIPTVAGR